MIGEPVQPECVSCGAANAPHARFCNQCGSGMGAPSSMNLPPTSSRLETERRQITVMFADLVGSTALSHELDAEDFSDLIKEYWALCDEVVVDQGGHVQQHLGDGVMAYFGHPRAHEDDARRAVEAGLGILQRLKSLSARLQLELSVTPCVRVGIHSGITVVGGEGLALGKTPNLAARLQALAEPDSVVVSDVTRRMVEGYFHLDDLGPRSIKGLNEPMSVYRVVGSTGAQSRMDAVGPRLTPLIGREAEAAKLNDVWKDVTGARQARIALISGEAGIGKSRLVQVLKYAIDPACTVLEGFCSTLHENTVLRPIAQAFESAAGLAGVHDGKARMTALEKYASAMGLGDEAPALLAPMLALPVPEGSPTAGLAPVVKRQRTMQALVDWLKAMASEHPLLFVVEDLHWADPSTVDFLQIFTDAAEKVPILVLGTCRPEFSATWRASALTVDLPRLPAEMARQVIEGIMPERALAPEVRDRVIELTDGVPLYLEEVTKAILESARPQLPTFGEDALDSLVPQTVHDSLTARLDRMGDHKSVAQLAAILGREFSDDVLRAIALIDESELNAALRQLTESGLLAVEDRAGGRIYRFKHALIQESAYQSLLKGRRRQYHHRVASVLLDQFPEVAEGQPGVIAHHYSGANLPKLASSHFQRAGDAAFEAQGYAEAMSYHRSALAQIQKLPVGKDRDTRELGALVSLGLPLLMTKGYAAPEVESAYERALTLSAEVDPPLRILFGIWAVQLVRGNREATDRMVSQFRRIAETSRDPGEKLISWAAVGSHAFWRGAFLEAIPALRAAAMEFEPAMLGALPRDYGYDNALYGHLYLAWALYQAGDLDEAEKVWQELWTISEATGAPYLIVVALSFGAAVARDLGDMKRAKELAERGVAMSTEHQLAFWLAIGRTHLGSALVAEGKAQEGIEHIEQGLGFCRAVGVMTPFTSTLNYLAEAHLRARDIDKGLSVVEEAMELSRSHVDRSGVVETLRVKGELLRVQGAPPAASEACFREALQMASDQGAKLFEVRVATSLAELLRDQGQAAQAKEVLGPRLSLLKGADPPFMKLARRLFSEL